MATKTLHTRIKNRVDSLGSWLDDNAQQLLDGEIAIVRVETGNTYENPVTGETEPVVELLMKVGDGSHTFEQLPWLSAKASDVYGWAKEQDPSNIEVSYNKGNAENPSWQKSTLADILKDLETAEANIASKAPADHEHTAYVNKNSFKTITVKNSGGGSSDSSVVADSVEDVLTIAGTNVTITGDTANDKITFAVADGSTTAKGVVQLSSATNSQSETVAATSKAVYEAYQKAADAASVAAGKADSGHNHNGTYLPVATTYAGSDTVGGAATSAKKVANKLSVTIGDSTTATEFDGSAAASVTINPSTIGAASQEAVFGNDGNGGLKGEIAGVAADLSELAAAVSKGVNFRGEVATAPSGNTYKLTTAAEDADPTPAKVGDMVICGEKEYVYIAENSWKELGDLSRVGALETAHTPTTSPAGTYTKVTVGANGHITSGSNPNTLAGYGITDAYTKSDVYTKSEVGSELATKSDTGHAHADYVNPNTFGTIKVLNNGGTANSTFEVHADEPADTLEFEGTNITITGQGGEAYLEKITFAVANGSTSTKGVVQLSDAVDSNSTDLAATANAVRKTYEVASGAAADLADKADKVHTHAYLPDTTTYAGSSSQGGAATSANKVNKSLTVQFNGGTTTSGTNINKFVFDGSAAKTINITPAAIGAATSGHTHSDYSSDIADMKDDLSKNVVKYDATNKKLKVGSDEIIIFDCGGALGWTD